MSAHPTSSSNSTAIALALSGGGFRATLFHLGVVRLLYDCNLLERVKLICSVSGGSILAAHLVLNWERYLSSEEFSDAAQEIIAFTQSDLRNWIIRRWLRDKMLLRPSALWGSSFVKLLQRRYDRLYRDKRITDFSRAGRPEILILSTSLTQGVPCKFTRSRFAVSPDPLFEQPGREVRIGDPKVSLAVAASSAFPPLFPAVQVDDHALKSDPGELDIPHSLTDGGVFDNIGLKEIFEAESKSGSKHDLIIVSDASANFHYKTGKKYSHVLSLARNIRANEIMMRRLGQLIMETNPGAAARVCKVQLGRLDEVRGALPIDVQRALRNIKTDMNAASDLEVDVLLRHGQLKARAALAGFYELDSAPTWFPGIDHRDEIEGNDFEDRLKRSKRSRSWKLAAKDGATWFLPLAAFLWIVVIWGLPLLLSAWHYKAHYEEKEEREVADIREAAAGYQQAKSEADRLKKLLYVIPIQDESHFPVAGASVAIEFTGGSTASYEGTTDASGLFRFAWDQPQQPIQAHIHITKSGFEPVNETRDLDERRLPITLYKSPEH